MNIRKNFSPIFCIIISMFCSRSIAHIQRPRLTIIIVVDQFAYSYLQKIGPYLNGGLKELMRKGVNYVNAHIPHGLPATATGHTALNTGTFAKDHGIIRNSWIENNKLVANDDDSVENAAVFSPDGFYDYAKSPHMIMVDGISDQFVLSSQPNTPRSVVTLSLKSRAAICTANKLGKAIWFDEESGLFTSSKAYFDTLPDWLKKFNAEKNIPNLTQVTWQLAKPRHPFAYNFYGIDDYSHTQSQKSMIGTKIIIDHSKNIKNRFEKFVETPQANKLLFDCARSCIDHYLRKAKNEELIIWLDMSGLDKVGHAYGPESKEAIDFVYHLDAQLSSFIRFAQRMGGRKRTLFALTADHGITPIPEHMAKRGISAERISQEKLIDRMNQQIEQKFGIAKAVVDFQAPQFYLDEKLLHAEHKSSNILHTFKNSMSRQTVITQELKNNIIQELKAILLKESYIKQAWSYDELEALTFEPQQLENFFKQQLYPGRSGSIIVQTHPYKEITRWKEGADHRTPYNYNTHVPLILYQHGAIELKTVHQNVWSIQLANTLADILAIPRPSASTFQPLPDLYSNGTCCL